MFLIRHEVQALLPLHAGRRMPTLVPERSIFRLPSLFLSKNPFYFPLSPHLPASLPLQVLSSLTQVGEESGTSRRWSGRLYTGAKYPLLYWRMGRHTHKKRVGQKGGGEDGQRLGESGHKTKIALCFNFLLNLRFRKWLFSCLH